MIPNDRIVTVDDIQGLIAANDPDRSPNIQTVRATLHRLVKEGTLKKVNAPQADRKLGYCLPDFDADAVRQLAAWAEQVLREAGKPMKAVENMVTMTERGYVLESEPQLAVRNLKRAMASRRFSCLSGSWVLSKKTGRNNNLLYGVLALLCGVCQTRHID
ncbi:hypothetical protein Pla100_31410 [Neorhodopirellula pilleata]|uniref:Uncharacterized protein n=1 Tax=Neorhodopirellula pilleata TaxID=2714738 RepID=A0A5C6A7Y2_9BACT|nr:hypothetical protein Pla100_31410 [Neorhodopirellula pilleata]